MSVGAILRAAVRSVASDCFYRPKFNSGDILVPKNVPSSASSFNLPRFDGDTLLEIIGRAPIEILDITRGIYEEIESAAPRFSRAKLGYLHREPKYYEIRVLTPNGVINNHNREPFTVGSSFHVSVHIVDSLFEKSNLRIARVA